MFDLPTESEPVRVIEGDCLDVLRTLPDGAVDSVVTDPPYGIGFPYLGYEDTRENLVALITGFLPEARRIARRRVIVLCGPTQISLYPQADWVGAVTWNTTGTHGKYGFNQWTPVLCYGPDVSGFGSVNGCLKSDVIAISGGSGVGFMRSPEEKRHTCPKPITIMRAVVRRYTEPDSIILDPFAGSGTTGHAAIAENRRAVLIEKERVYADLSRRRVREAMGGGLLAGV